jgi:MoaD family protein
MNVEVMFFGKLREIAGHRHAITMVDSAHLSDLIERLNKEYGFDFGKELNSAQRLSILINGHVYNLLGNLEITLKHGDVVAFVPIILGG